MKEPIQPGGSVTFLFTDIEKSTMLWERHGEHMRAVLARHDNLLRRTVEENDGQVVKTTGDGLHAAFPSASSALQAAIAAQQALKGDQWSEIAPDTLRVRMGLHSGEAQQRDGDYYGKDVNRAARIMDLGHGGQVLISSATAALLDQKLPPEIDLRDLGLVRIRGLQKEERIFQIMAPGLPGDFPPLRADRKIQGNLPARISSFVGRSREMSEIRAALDQTRLLTLTGPGGTGKSRIALQIAADVQAEYEHGAWLVELAPVTDPQLVPGAVAAVFGLQGQTQPQIKEILFDFLHEKELLLILDNCEHLINAIAQLASELIRECPRLTILASSREGLGIYGERTYHLPTMSLPDPDQRSIDAVRQSEAVQLFIERADAVQQGFQLNENNAPTIADVVRRLDGIPLAIELAAARLSVFTIDQMASRLDQRFRLLTGGSRTAMPRQQTLRALIDWSYDLLDEEERRLFRLLSVFKGGWTFDAAEYVAQPLDVFLLLPQLVSKSLVSRNVENGSSPDGENAARYTYLETIRQYALDRLIEQKEIEEARDRHFAYFENRAQNTLFTSKAGGVGFTSGHVITEQDNLRAALEWSIDRYPQRTLNLVWNLIFFLSDQLPGSEGIEWTSAALDRLDEQQPDSEQEAQELQKVRLKGLVSISMLKMFMGQLEESSKIAGELVEPLKNFDVDPIMLAITLFVRAQTAYFLESPELEESISQAEALLRQMEGHPARDWMLAMVLLLSAESEARKENLEKVAQHFHESSELLERTENTLLPWVEYSRLMIIWEMQMGFEYSRRQFEKSIAILRQSNSRRMAAMAESDWAHQLRRHGDLEQAMQFYSRLFVEWRDLGHRAAMANILENIGFIDRAQGRAERAVTLFGAAERLREEFGQEMLPMEREEYAHELAELKKDLPAPEFQAAWKNGRLLSTDEIIKLITA